LNEFFIGEDILYFQKRAGFLIAGLENPLFGDGWETSPTVQGEQILRKTNAAVCVLNLPLFFKGKPGLRMRMEIQLPEEQKGAQIDFYVDDRFLRSQRIRKGGEVVLLHISPKVYESKVNRLILRVHQRDESKEVPVLLLKEITFEAS